MYKFILYTSQQGPYWNSTKLAMTHSGEVSLAFVATRGPDHEGDIAIDDVTITTSCADRKWRMIWERLPHHWLFVRGIHWSVYLHKGPVMQSFDVFFAVIPNNLLNSWISGNLRRHDTHVTSLSGTRFRYGIWIYSFEVVTINRTGKVGYFRLKRTKSWNWVTWRCTPSEWYTKTWIRHIQKTADVPVNFQGYWKSLKPNLAASRIHEVVRYYIRPLSV